MLLCIPNKIEHLEVRYRSIHNSWRDNEDVTIEWEDGIDLNPFLGFWWKKIR